MKFAVISDIHANLEALQATLDAISGQDVDRIVCLGDIVGYHADPEDCTNMVRNTGAISVAGSHDRAVTGQISTDGFSSTAVLGVEWTRKRASEKMRDYLAALPLEACVEGSLIAVHGALLPEGGCATTRIITAEHRKISFDALKQHPSGARICAFGHTHALGIYELHDGVERILTGDKVTLRKDAYYLINPGAVGQPRRTKDRRATYMTLDTAQQCVEVHRIKYDFTAAMAKARKAGLVRIYTGLPTPLPAMLKWSAQTLGVYKTAKRISDKLQQSRRNRL